jgi:hypothetical protein
MKLEMYKVKYTNTDNIILYKNNIVKNKLTFDDFQRMIESNEPFILQWNDKLIEINSYKNVQNY